MSTVARIYPAHTDSNGNTWYRPVRDEGVGVAQWGWTSNPALADPSYAAAATLCSTANATPGDRALILRFAAELVARGNQPSRCSCGLATHGCVCAGDPACDVECAECDA